MPSTTSWTKIRTPDDKTDSKFAPIKAAAYEICEQLEVG